MHVHAARTARLFVLTALAMTFVAAHSGTTGAQPGGLRSVDWQAVLERHPLIEIQRGLPPPWDSFGPYVTIRPGVLPGTGEVSGHARLTGILYGDLDGDGVEEAVIPLDSGGTAGAIGLLLFREMNGVPELVLARDGYKLGIELRDGWLTLNEPIYVGFEGNCCPSGWERTSFVLAGNGLIAVAYAGGGYPQARIQTIEAFYRALNEGRIEDAYAFLSPAFQEANPFDAWAAGYRGTLRIEIEAENGPGEEEVSMRLTATDRTTTGASIIRRFAGSWFLFWNGSRWLLDRASIREV